MKRFLPVLAAILLLAACGETSLNNPSTEAEPQPTQSEWITLNKGGSISDSPEEAPSYARLGTQALGETFTNNGGAPVSFSAPSSTVAVEDSAGNSDSYTAGAVTIPVKIHRVIPDVKKAIELGTLSSKATVTFWVYDIDSDGGECPELNTASINGYRLGDLRGANGTWTRHEFSVPISKFNFPSKPGASATNTFRMDIDVNGCDQWLAEVDYVQIEFEAADPIVFVHGILSSAERWNVLNSELVSRGFVTANTVNLRYEDFPANALMTPASCNQEQFQSVAANVKQLRTFVEDILTGLGAERVHLITHSKGGIDSRAFINDIRNNKLRSRVGTLRGQAVEGEIEVASLTTLNTPHAGSPAADLGVAYALSQNGRTTDPELLDTLLQSDGGFIRGRVVSQLLGKNHVCDLTQNSAREYSRSNPVTVPILASWTNADSNGDNVLSSSDAAGFGPAGSGFVANGVINQLYTFVGNTSTLVYTDTAANSPTSIYRVTQVENPSFKVNDVVVTRSSASDDGGISISITDTGINHNGIGVVDATLEPIINQGTNGSVDWSKRQ